MADSTYAPRALVRHVRLVPVGANPSVRAAGSPPGLPDSSTRGASTVPASSAQACRAAADDVVDLRLVDGLVAEVGPRLAPQPGEAVLDGDGRWAIPGLWDQHVHLGQWAQARERVSLEGSTGPAEVLRRVADHIAALGSDRRGQSVLGYGYRSGPWAHQPTVAALDAVSEGHPVALVSGDAHNGWLNARALALLGLDPRDTPLEEGEWFAVIGRLSELPGAERDQDAAYRTALADAARLGVVGVVDFEFGANFRDWPPRFARGLDTLRVRTATYADLLGEVVAAGLRTGDALGSGAGLLTMGPLKVISDGSINTRTAYCCEPYAGAEGWAHPRGRQNITADALGALLEEATAAGLEVAVHAIGDAAVADAVAAFGSSGARGSLEHAQLVRWAELGPMAARGIRASVQPAHLLDDRGLTEQVWPDRQDRTFALRALLDAGVVLALGSDAPVARLDPWLAMAAAVHRGPAEAQPWHPEQAISAAEALAASTDGQTTLAPGSRADVVLLDRDPLAVEAAGSAGSGDGGDSAGTAAYLLGTEVEATLVAGRVVFSRL